MCSLSQGLPVEAIIPELRQALQKRGCAVLTAPPGSGKSTLLPLLLIGCNSVAGICRASASNNSEAKAAMQSQPNLGGSVAKTATVPQRGRIVMLEPRRIAARQIAERMASLLGESCGQTVGYRMRYESKYSAETRILVVTEGVLVRMIMADPTLEGISTVIFDEFHERSLASDQALAMCRECRKELREDLSILIMSATIDSSAICSALGAELIECNGKCFPVENIYLGSLAPESFSVKDVSISAGRAVLQAAKEQSGDILAFLPGEAEIRLAEEMLAESLDAEEFELHPLYGNLPFEDQRKAISPSRSGKRKIVLATPIAETSITIEGVRSVIDCGLCKRLIFSPQSGLSHLQTMQISMDMADQRAGRAGRVAPGVCYRLWSEQENRNMSPVRKPEILDADLSSLILDLCSFGYTDPYSLNWLTPPPKSGVAYAKELLQELGAISAETGTITKHGKEIGRIPCHPRLANMLLFCRNNSRLAGEIAAILEEKDILPQEICTDVSLRVQAFRKRPFAYPRIKEASLHFANYAGKPGAEVYERSVDPYEVGAILARAYPERIAKLQDKGIGEFLLANGKAAYLQKEDPLSGCEWIVAVNTNSAESGRILLAAPVSAEDLVEMSREREIFSWDSRKGCVSARKDRMIGKLVLESRTLAADPHGAQKIICEAMRKEGLSMLDFNDQVQNLQRRIAQASAWHPELELPDVSTEKLLQSGEQWLVPFLDGAMNVQELKKIDLCPAIWSLLSYSQQQEVELIAPSHITMPNGRKVALEYRVGATEPILRVRLQECFGMMDTPRVDKTRVPVLMELLSPGFKPVQLTKDLKSFWSGTYYEVRKELKRRYPKHSWPEKV